MTKEQFEDIKQRLKVWRDDRNLTQESQRACLFDNLKEELDEYEKAKDDLERVDALCDIAVLIFNSYDVTFEIFSRDADKMFYSNILIEIINLFRDDLDLMHDILFYCYKVCETEFNFDFYKCMVECIKHISSREQNPIQAKEWDKLRKQGLPITEKWVKNKEQDKNTLYEPNYANCRVKVEN